MPHKHTRREKNDEDFELPPTQVAKPLRPTSISKKKAPPEKKNAQNSQNDPPKKEKKRKRDADDVPRAFKRIMNLQAGRLPRSGLDNGDQPKGKKGKKKADEKPAPKPAPAATPSTNPDLQIRPGEKLYEFNQRVDAALPLSGLITKTTVKDGKDPLGLKVRRTKKERKMHNMYDEWREIDKRVKERREEELEALEEKEMENEAMGISWKLDMEAKSGKKKGKKGKRTRYIGEEGGPEGDPWEEIKKKRGETKVGLNEVAHAPPELKLPKRNSLVLGAKVEVSDIPKAAGSLRQREELQEIREDVVAQYRKLMESRRAALAAAADE
ncbi:hypothetical protein QBC35DRAFT_486670 [Podospora australis]|uniref:Urease accessory protein n=1 Tax=Podospora australis TaxID=1536484 RepID=A0AAN7ALK0_9PEZI|nr:hypothetical protein QBC35DRAFT_486670 [Podospora australis]